MNRHKKESTLIFSLVSLAAYAAGELPPSRDMELIQSVNRGYYSSMNGKHGMSIKKIYENLTEDNHQVNITDERIVKTKEKNYFIKLDKSTLPDEIKVINMNPKLKKITSHILNKINFSLQNQSKESESNE